MPKEYLGDGLYADDRGHHIELSCERENGTNWVALDGETLMEFIRFLERSRKVKIKVTEDARD